ncbi:MAG: redoxin family protein [Leadbetterella sp.]
MKRLLMIPLFIFSFSRMYAASDSLTVYIFLSEECPVCQLQTLPLRELHSQFKDQGVGFLSVFSNPSSNDSKIFAFCDKYNLKFPTVFDSTQQVAKRLEARITPEVVVVDHSKNESIVYRGAVDNSYASLGKRRRVINQHYLNDALSAILKGSKNYVENTEPIGCYITF